MCDTLLTVSPQGCWLAKNSDREPTEAQLAEWYDAKKQPSGRLATTYLTVDVPEHRHKLWLSRPYWMWGGEMGVNEHGVVIGNEAVFTKLINHSEQKLLGMDLIRLALEQAQSADEALDVITRYLTKYGQGGSAGDRNKKFRYDNSFLIADATKGWQLETAGPFWVAKQITTGFAAISNHLSITNDYDLSSEKMEDRAKTLGLWKGKGDFNFQQTFATQFMPWAGRANQRRSCNLTALRYLPETPEPHHFALALRQHHRKNPSTNADVCMHAAGPHRPSQSTQSMIVQTSPGDCRIWSTGSALPCSSAYKVVDDKQTDFLTEHPEFWSQWQVVLTKANQDRAFRQWLKTENSRLESKLWQRPDNHLQLTEQWWQTIHQELAV